MQLALSRSQMTQKDKQDLVIKKGEEKTSTKKETLMCKLKRDNAFPYIGNTKVQMKISVYDCIS